MRRSPLKRRTPLRSHPKRHEPSHTREDRPMARPLPKAPNYSGTTTGRAIAKEDASQSPAYMAAVKALGYCMRCGTGFAAGFLPDFCHRNAGKGKSIKTDVREGWPGCRACHRLIDEGGLPREQRRAEELDLGRRTRAAIAAAGLWPARLPKWDEA